MTEPTSNAREVSIESLRNSLEATTYPPSDLTIEGLRMLDDLSAAITELEGLRAEKAGLKVEDCSPLYAYQVRMERDALRAERDDAEARFSKMLKVEAALRASNACLVAERDELKAELAAEMYPMAANPLAAKYADLLTAERSRAEEAEGRYKIVCEQERLGSIAFAAERSRADALAARVEAAEKSYAYSYLESERSRGDALAERVGVLTRLALGKGAQHIYHGDCPDADDCDARDPDCPACAILSSTPAADLSARDDRIRREALEAAAKKCAEAYWAMVAPKDHAAMHPTIEFWRDALGLEPMSSAEHEALDALELEIARLEGRVSAQDEMIASMQREAIRSVPLEERAFVLKTQAELFALQDSMAAHDTQVLRETVERVRDFFNNTNGPEDWCHEDLESTILTPTRKQKDDAAPMKGLCMTGVEAIAAERKRQVEAEGWTPEHDNHHNSGELAAAAACYALVSIDGDIPIRQDLLPIHWPWGFQWWKPKDTRSNLVRAGALIAAEIDRLDRHTTPPQEQK